MVISYLFGSLISRKGYNVFHVVSHKRYSGSIIYKIIQIFLHTPEITLFLSVRTLPVHISISEPEDIQQEKCGAPVHVFHLQSHVQSPARCKL